MSKDNEEIIYDYINVKLVEKKKKNFALMISLVSLIISAGTYYTNNKPKVSFLVDGVSTKYENEGMSYEVIDGEEVYEKTTQILDGIIISVVNEGKKSAMVNITEVEFFNEDGNSEKRKVVKNLKDDKKDSNLFYFNDVIYNYGREQHVSTPYLAKSESITDLFFVSWKGFNKIYNSDLSVKEIKFYGNYEGLVEKKIESDKVPIGFQSIDYIMKE